MYKFSRDEQEDKQYREDAVGNASDTAAPQAASPQEALKARLVSLLDPQLQERYKARRQAAIEQQEANYQGPEALQALQDGQNFRALQTGLQRAANKFGSAGGDGGPKSDFGDTAKSFDDSARQNFALKDAAYKSGVKAEDKAVDGEYQSRLRPLELESKLNSNASQQFNMQRNQTLASREDANYEAQKSAAADDANPASEVSRTYQMLAKKMLPAGNFEGVPASKIKALIPGLEGMYRVEQAAQARRDAANQAAQSRRDAADARVEAARVSAETKAASKVEKEPNKEQFEAGGFSKRMEQAESIFDKLAQDGFDRTSTTSGLSSILPNSLQSTNMQQQEQAERNFVNSVLRRESGAAISPSEFDSAAKQYFPRTGDSAEVIANKKANRQQAIASIKAASGNAYNKIPDVSKSDAPAAPSKVVHGKDLP